jgi:hypothetical protein
MAARPAGEDEPGVKWGAITLPPEADNCLQLRAGLYRCELPIFHPGATSFSSISAGGIAPLLVPGEYQVRLAVDDQVVTKPVTLYKDPRLATTQDEFEAQLALMRSIRDKVSEIHAGVHQIRRMRQQIEERLHVLSSGRFDRLHVEASGLLAQLRDIESDLIQTRRDEHSGELDGIHFPPKLNAKLASLAYSVARSDNAPAGMAYAVYADLAGRADELLRRLRALQTQGLHDFNQLALSLGAPAIWLGEEQGTQNL